MPPSATPRLIVIIVVGTLSLLSIIGMVTLALALFYKGYKADPVILAAFIPITSGAIGSLGTLLANTRQPVNGGGTTTTTSTTTTPHASDSPTPVVIQQPTNTPVPVTETPKIP